MITQLTVKYDEHVHIYSRYFNNKTIMLLLNHTLKLHLISLYTPPFTH